MDCEKFDQVVIDALYGELDELTMAALRRHTEGCPRCQTAWSGLRATRKIGVLPLAPAPAGLPARALEIAQEAHHNVSWPTRFGRLMSRAAGYAMRPQTAMAAIFLLAIGSAVLVMRPRPERTAGQSRVSVTERGVPEPSGQERRFAAASPRRDDPAPSAPAIALTETAEREFHAGPTGRNKAEDLGESVSGRMRPSSGVAESELAKADLAKEKSTPMAASEPAPIAQLGGGAAAKTPVTSRPSVAAAPVDGSQAMPPAHVEVGQAAGARAGRDPAWAELEAAKAVEETQGCQAAAAKYEEAVAKYQGSGAGAEALWSAANCYKALGELGKARQMFLRLRSIPGYRDRAEAQLSSPALVAQTPQAQPARAARPAAKPATPSAPAQKSRGASSGSD